MRNGLSRPAISLNHPNPQPELGLPEGEGHGLVEGEGHGSPSS